LQIDNVIVLGEPRVVRFLQCGTGALESGADPFGRAALEFGGTDQSAGLADEGRPIGLERQLELNADHAIVVIFGAARDALSAVESDEIDGFGDGRAFKAEVLRNGRSAAGGGFGTAGCAECTESVQVNGLSDLVKKEDAKAAAK